jgi:uncharacterized protein (DUF1330 family)
MLGTARWVRPAAMPAYVIVDIDVHDPDLYHRDYAPHAPATIERYGGRYIARGGAVEVREGDWEPGRLVVIEFPDVDAARRWHDSEEYRPLRDVRDRAATARLIITEGLSPG